MISKNKTNICSKFSSHKKNKGEVRWNIIVVPKSRQLRYLGSVSSKNDMLEEVTEIQWSYSMSGISDWWTRMIGYGMERDWNFLGKTLLQNFIELRKYNTRILIGLDS